MAQRADQNGFYLSAIFHAVNFFCFYSLIMMPDMAIEGSLFAKLRPDAGQHFGQIVISFLFFEWLTHQLKIWVDTLLPRCKSFSPIEKDMLISRITSLSHSVIVFLPSVYCLLFDEASRNDVLSGDSWLIRTVICISIGFFLSDFRYVLGHMDSDGGWDYILHHLSALWPYSLVVFTGCLSYFANFRLLAEFSTPFVNLRWYLAFTDQRNTSLYFYNGLIMTASFFLCRIVCMPVYWHEVIIAAMGEEFWRMSLLIRLSWLLPCAILDVLNVIWFKKMLLGAIKVIQFQKSKSAELIEKDHFKSSKNE